MRCAGLSCRRVKLRNSTPLSVASSCCGAGCSFASLSDVARSHARDIGSKTSTPGGRSRGSTALLRKGPLTWNLLMDGVTDLPTRREPIRAAEERMRERIRSTRAGCTQSPVKLELIRNLVQDMPWLLREQYPCLWLYEAQKVQNRLRRACALCGPKP